MVALELVMWPLLVWAVATRRVRGAVLALGVSLATTIAAWAVVGFAGFLDYPDLLARIEGQESYSIADMMSALGFGAGAGRIATLLVGGAVLVACVALARAGDERRAFVVAVAAALTLSPILWLHYLALLVVPLGLMRPRFSAIWLLPIVLWVSPKSENGAGLEPFRPHWSLPCWCLPCSCHRASSAARSPRHRRERACGDARPGRPHVAGSGVAMGDPLRGDGVLRRPSGRHSGSALRDGSTGRCRRRRFRPHYSAAQDVLGGESPYPSTEELGAEELRAYVYPPLLPLVTVPFTALPFEAAGLVFMAILVAAAVGTLFVLGLRDWRCYGIALIWPPVLSAIQTGNVTLLSGCARRLPAVPRSHGPRVRESRLTLATKFFLWPLVVWLAATRRFAAAVLSCVAGAVLLLAPGRRSDSPVSSTTRSSCDARRHGGGDSYTLTASHLAGAPDGGRASWARRSASRSSSRS